MINLREYRHSTTQLADFLPWAALVDKGIVLNKDGSFQRTAKFRGPDLDSAVPAELVGVAGRLNNALRRLGSGWAVFVEAHWHLANQYPEGYFPDVASALVDVERRAQFEEEGAHYESCYFLTFLYLPPPEDTARAEGFLYELNRLAFPYRWSTRAIMLDKTDATRLLTKIRRQWFAKRKSIAAILKEVMTNEASTLLDTDAHNKAMDADAALQELGSDAISQAFVTSTVTVWDDDPRVADEKLRLVEKVIQGRDFTCMVESVNAIEAWLGSLPGHAYANVRQPPVSTP